MLNFHLQYTCASGLIDFHPLRWRWPAQGGHFVGSLVGLDGFAVDMGLEALVEVVGAYACRADGDEKEQDGQNGKRGQRLAGGFVVLLADAIGDVHADELEEEVGQGDKVDEDDDNHAGDGFAADPEGGREEKEKGDDEGDAGEGELESFGVVDDDEELNGEGEEEEEVEFEKGNVNLRRLAW